MLMSRYALIQRQSTFLERTPLVVFMSQLLIGGVMSVQVQGGCGCRPWSRNPTADQGHRHGGHRRRGSHASNARYVLTKSAAAKPPVSYCIALRHLTQSVHALVAWRGADGNGRGGGARRDDRGMGRGRRDDGVLAAIQQRRLQGIPEYLRSYVDHALVAGHGLACQPALVRNWRERTPNSLFVLVGRVCRLYVVLPPHTGPPPDVDTIIRSLRDHPMPAKPAGTAPPPKVPTTPDLHPLHFRVIDKLSSLCCVPPTM